MTVRRMLIATPILFVAAVVAGVAIWWFFVRETHTLATNAPDIPADLRATPGSTPASGGTAASTAASGGALTFKIIPERSQASYFADEQLASLPIPDTAQGSTNSVSGDFRLTPDGNLDPSQPSKFTVDLTTLKSDKDMRDRRVQNNGLETSKFPTATFIATKVTGWDNTKPAGEEQDIQLTGMLDLHGVQKEVTWDTKAKRDGNVITALATLKDIKYDDFNIPKLNIAGFVSVQDTVSIQVSVVAQQE
jgi:polyisoprenoid-binding protein YceI